MAGSRPPLLRRWFGNDRCTGRCSEMMHWIIGSSLRLRLLVVPVAAGLMLLGITQLRSAPVDVLPEFNPPLVDIQTEALGLSAEEVEQLVTVPLEQDLLNGVAFLDQIRSQSLPGLSRIELIFQPGTDVLKARQLVQERLVQAPGGIPNVSKAPSMLQPLSSTGRVMMIGLSSKDVSLIDMSIRDTSLEDSPIIMTRPVDDSGCSMLGALDTFGMPPGAWTRRSCTSCRAFSTSVPGWKISSIRDSPGSDWERIWSRNATPLSRSCSSGTVTSCSTSSAESPSASVWMSTSGGLNSGRTSTGALRSWVMPSSISPAATGTTRSRNLRLDPMIQCIISEHRPVQRSLPNHLPSSRGRPAAVHPHDPHASPSGPRGEGPEHPQSPSGCLSSTKLLQKKGRVRSE